MVCGSFGDFVSVAHQFHYCSAWLDDPEPELPLML